MCIFYNNHSCGRYFKHRTTALPSRNQDLRVRPICEPVAESRALPNSFAQLQARAGYEKRGSGLNLLAFFEVDTWTAIAFRVAQGRLSRLSVKPLGDGRLMHPARMRLTYWGRCVLHRTLNIARVKINDITTVQISLVYVEFEVLAVLSAVKVSTCRI